ncbi:MAG: hypothetical protein NTU65_08705, partial [Cyanobacteria bacterium]|nr:hypothetical protein [Cyanobacteriota bacterium]
MTSPAVDGSAPVPSPAGPVPGSPQPQGHPAEALILALDRPDAASALALAAAIPGLRWVKVGLELF